MSTSQAVAIIGMGCRFPGAASLEQFWSNLENGVESISRFGPVTPVDRGYEVYAAGVLDDIAGFDAGLFGVSAREAERMDPQHRVLLECAWEAAERAGYDPRRLPGRTGVFAGTGFNEYLIRNLAQSVQEGDLSLTLTNGASFLPARLAYLLGCTGPAISVSTACSTSLVAVHLAVQSLLAGECDSAIAGGVRITTPQHRPYRHEPGGIGSPDGHCRAFDREANGTVGGNGAGAVVLRRLDDALADGDPIAAVIIGSAVTNDGAARVGFSAPGVDGQRSAIREAQMLAGVPPDSLGMVEAHGTATALGDPVEFEALTAAFRQGTARRGFCALGSVKTNIGHLDVAAGIAGLIKTVLALQHRVIPPSLHFHEPNPRINLDDSPFFVNTAARPWLEDTRRAGVSSFGMGGTNAHLVLESAPEPRRDENARFHVGDGPRQLVLSARSEAAVRRLALDLADHLERERPPLADVAHTLAVSRAAFEWRIEFECASLAQAITLLRSNPSVTRAMPGATVDARRGRRLALPPTPFERQRYWIDAPSPLARVADPARWLYAPRLRQSTPLGRPVIDTQRHWLVLTDQHGLGARVTAVLRDAGARVVEVAYDEPLDTQAIHALAAQSLGGACSIVSLWSLASEPDRDDDAMLQRHYLRPAQWLRAWADRAGGEVDISFVVDGALAGFEAPTAPEKAMLLGLARALPAEYPGWRARVVELDADAADLVECIVAEACARRADGTVIHRHGSRWIESVEPIEAAINPPLAIRRGGVYLVTGGNSGMGLAIGRHLVEAKGARVIALSRRGGDSTPGLTAIAVDVSDTEALRRVIARVRAEYGPIHGVVHCAGMPPHALLRTATDNAVREVLAGKFLGARNLRRILEDDPPDFVMLCSSLRGYAPTAGAGDYMAANLALEALSESWAASGVRVHAIAWDTWSDVGMAAASNERFTKDEMRDAALAPEEGIQVFEMAPTCGMPRVAVSTRELDAVRQHASEAYSVTRASDVHEPGRSARYPRPALSVAYVPARTALETRLAAIWSEVLGFEPIGVTDDFFDLGGDSIATLQIVARAKEEGIHLDTHRAFLAHTVEELADTGIGYDASAVPRETLLPLSPTQQWLFGCGSGDINRFVQGVVIGLPAEIDAATLGAAVDGALAHHAALAVRFVQTESGWKQVIGTPGPVVVDTHRHLGAGDSQLAYARELGQAMQCMLDVRAVPLLRVALVLGPAGAMLVLVVHHLLIDALGWRILLDDLQERLGATHAQAGASAPMPDESFLQWAIALERLADTDEFADDAAFWSSFDTPPAAFPLSRRSGPRRSLTSTLSAAQTLALTASRRPIEALLAVAVARAVRTAAASDQVAIDIESLGRGWARVPLDVSRTIGWFTAIHPLVVDTAGTIDAAATQAATLLPAARRRAVAYALLRQAAPDRLPDALRSDAPVSIVFFPDADAASAWSIAAVLPAPDRMPAPHAVVLSATVDNGALSVTWHGQAEPFEGLTLDTIAARAMDGLRTLATGEHDRLNTILTQLDMSEDA